MTGFVNPEYLVEADWLEQQEALEAKATYIRMLERIADVPMVKAWNVEHGDSPDLNQRGDGIEPLNISIKLSHIGF